MAQQVDPSSPILEITPNDVSIAVVLEKEISIEFKLKNLTNQPVAYKIKTNAPDKYHVRKIQAIIPPDSTDICVIILRSMKEFPNFNEPKEYQHKFLFQSVHFNGSSDELGPMWKTLETEQKQKGIPTYHNFRVPCTLKNETDFFDSSKEVSVRLKQKIDDYNSLMDYSIRQSHQIKKLKTTLSEMEETVNSAANDLSKSRKRSEELEKQLQALLSENEKSKQQNATTAVAGMKSIPIWFAIIALVLGVILGKAIM